MEPSKYELRVVRGAVCCWEAWRAWAKSKKNPVLCNDQVACKHGKGSKGSTKLETWPL